VSEEPSLRAVLADDHAVVRAGIRQFLEAAGGIQVVAEVGDGPAAVEAVKAHSPDVVVLDIQMPGMTGIEVTRWVRANASRTGVLILSAFDDDPYILAVLQAGANGYVLKTADAADIVQAVRAVHEGKSALDPEIARKVMAQVSGRSLSVPVERPTDRELEVLALAAGATPTRPSGCSWASATAPCRATWPRPSTSCRPPAAPRR
jgi:DNA-binding NarL/FixJ family response regulator